MGKKKWDSGLYLASETTRIEWYRRRESKKAHLGRIAPTDIPASENGTVGDAS